MEISTNSAASTERQRSRERYRLAGLTVAANVVSRAAAMFLMVLTVRLTVPYLGPERFGVWMTIASLAALLSFLDLGIGNALTNRVARSATNSEPEALRRAISGGLGFLFCVAASFGVVLTAFSHLLPWQSLLSPSLESVELEIARGIQVFVILFAVNLFTTGITRVFYGLQRGFEAHVAATLGSFLSLGLLWLAASAQAGIPILLVSAMAGPIFAGLVLLAVLAKRRQFGIRMASRFAIPESRNLLGAGGYFFLLQLATMVSWGADSLIIAGTLGAAYVALFNICHRLFQFVSQPLALVNSALWPSYANAYACGDTSFIKRTLAGALAGSLLIWAVLSSILVLFGPEIVSWWTDGVIVVSQGLLVVFSAWLLCEVIGVPFAMYLNGCNLLRIQVYSSFSLLLVALPLKLFLVQAYGLPAMLLGFLVLYFVNFLFWFGMVFRPQVLKPLRER
jgi:O-antigen/teichoic acid export membrane protein